MQVDLNGKKVKSEKNETILELAKRNNIKIPTLCYDKDLKTKSRCRLCVVEVNGELKTSCDTKVKKGMKIKTNTEMVKKSRKITEKLIQERERRIKKRETNSPITRDFSKCIVCGNCVDVCQNIQTANAITETERGINTEISTPFKENLRESSCTFCGQCVYHCDLDAINERDDTKKVKKLLNKKEKHVLVQTAPSIRASLGEMFRISPGTLVTGRMVTALKKLGFDKVFDTDFGADLTTIEETNEFLERLNKNENIPLFTSCCPAWIKFTEHNYPDLLKNLSTCKSPHMMFGSIAKSHYAEKEGIKPENIAVVSIMPCTAKKFEIERKEMKINGNKNVDFVLTTRELGRLLKENKIELKKMKKGKFDKIMGTSTGSAAIYGATGGVAESVLRYASNKLGEKRKKIKYKNVRGLEGIKKATVKINNKKIKMAIANGLGNIRKLMEMIKDGKDFDIVELMACPGGCIGGGGQPKSEDEKILEKRSKALYKQDEKMKLKTADENPKIKKLYKDFLDKISKEEKHKLLHTKYKKRK